MYEKCIFVKVFTKTLLQTKNLTLLIFNYFIFLNHITMNTILRNGCFALLLVFTTAMTLSAQIKPGKKKTTTTPTEQTDTPSPSDKPASTESTDNQPSTSPRQKTAAKKTDQYFDESGGFKHRLQYGAHMNPSIASLFGGAFNIRVDPIIGYKFNNRLMAGLTGGIDYTSIRYQFQGAQGIENYRYNALNTSFGVYGRVKVLPSIYLHTDYRLANYTRANQASPFDIANKKINVEKVTLPELNVGAVYRSGMGALGYELALSYNVLYKDATYAGYKESPFDIKIGLTYNF